MKNSKMALCLLGVALLALTGCKDTHRIVEPKDGPAHLVVQPTEWNVGRVTPASGTLVREFAMINDGSEDLVIKSVENMCSCTHTEYVEKPVAPGHGRALKVSFDTGHLSRGEFLREIVVHTNGGDVVISLRGNMDN